MIDQMKELWEKSENPLTWEGNTTPDKDLIWKSGHSSQIKDISAISHLLNLPARVAGSHRSKSVALPVSMFRAEVSEKETIFFFMRDNFHDHKLVVVSSCPISGIPYDLIHQRLTPEELFEEKMRSFNYCSPKEGKKGSHNYDANDYESDAWFSKWCSDSILRENGDIYRCGTVNSCYYEGISRIVPSAAFVRYEQGRQAFAVGDMDILKVMSVMKTIVRAAWAHVLKERECA